MDSNDQLKQAPRIVQVMLQAVVMQKMRYLWNWHTFARQDTGFDS